MSTESLGQKWLRHRLLLLGVLLLGSCAVHGAGEPLPEADRLVEEDAVYAAALYSLYPASGNAHWLVADSTDPAVSEDELVPGFREDFARLRRLRGETLDDLMRALPRRRSLTPATQAVTPLHLVSGAALDSLPRGALPAPRDPAATGPRDFWSGFHLRFPNARGVVRLSRVGFSRDRRQAVLMVSYGCGGLCGGGSVVLLERRDGRWRVVQREETWVS